METECDEIMVDARHSSGLLDSKQSNKECILTHRRDSQNEKLDSEISIKTSEDIEKKEPFLKRRKIFNLTKHIISTILIVMDLTLDWIEYSAMNNTGNYSINIERDYKKIKYTVECENSGESIQVIFLIVSVIGTFFSGLQIVNIIHQFYHELRMPRDKNLNERLIHEYLEIFPSLVIEVMQILLIMGFYGVCTLDFSINISIILIALNGLVSLLKLFWRFVGSSKCCTVYLKQPRTGQNRLRNKFKCEKSCKCCTIRCFPSSFEEQYKKACDCTCKKCLSCEQFFKCCICRCFPTYLPTPKNDVIENKCGECMHCESNCRCCLLRCFPAHLNPPKRDLCTCRCQECLSCTSHLKCFICRCFPKYQSPSHSDICTCTCAKCLSCQLPCKCVILRCFPKHQNPPNLDWLECICGECLKCKQNCFCCILRCFPSLLGEDEYCTCTLKEQTACEQSFVCCVCRCFPSKLKPLRTDVFECKCAHCLACESDCQFCKLRCFPNYLHPSKEEWFVCTCCNTKVTTIAIHSVPIPEIHSQLPVPVMRRELTRPLSVDENQPMHLPVVQQLIPMPIIQQHIPLPIIQQPFFVPVIQQPIFVPILHQPIPLPVIQQPIPISVIQQPTVSQEISKPETVPENPNAPPSRSKPLLSKQFRRKVKKVAVVSYVTTTGFSLGLYACLVLIQLRFVLFCIANDTFMQSVQDEFVKKVLKLFDL